MKSRDEIREQGPEIEKLVQIFKKHGLRLAENTGGDAPDMYTCAREVKSLIDEQIAEAEKRLYTASQVRYALNKVLSRQTGSDVIKEVLEDLEDELKQLSPKPIEREQ